MRSATPGEGKQGPGVHGRAGTAPDGFAWTAAHPPPSPFNLLQVRGAWPLPTSLFLPLFPKIRVLQDTELRPTPCLPLSPQGR